MLKKDENKSNSVTFFDLISAPWSYRFVANLDLLFFIISCILILLLFIGSNLIEFPSIWNFIAFVVVSFGLSLLIMKPEGLIKIKTEQFNSTNEQGKDQSKNNKNNISPRFLIKYFWIVLPRIAFFNILYYFFPIFIIFVASVFVFQFFGGIIITDGNRFLQGCTLIGIILGFFQYYLRRYEEKTQRVLVAKMTGITGVIIKQASYVNFKKFIERKNEENNRSQKRYKELLELIKKTTENPIYKLRDKRYPGKEIIYYQPQFIVGGGDEFLFNLLESEVDNEQLEKKLRDAYKEFFEEVKKESKEKLKKDVGRIEELIRLLFSNISIVGEAKVNFLEVMYDLKKYEEPSSYSDFLIKTNYEILNELITKMLNS